MQHGRMPWRGSGKDGFHLGLFGYDPAGDYWRITQQMVGRRSRSCSPEQSWLLLKATGAVPHSGGRRFKKDSEYYQTLLRWIQAGAPDDAVPFHRYRHLARGPDKFVFSGKVKTKPLESSPNIRTAAPASSTIWRSISPITKPRRISTTRPSSPPVTKATLSSLPASRKYTTGAEMIVAARR